ncbi:MAG: glycosyltransferase family 2 protein [Clostridia bacterium]|nr:glycosyltransferase family 2 protein [Clostridia bacterium]
MEKVAIIVPVYNVEPYIKRCVDSLINQTYKNIQIILVDDGSPDNCGEICDKYAETDSRIVCLHKENGGQSSARNMGLDWFYENSDAQWLSFIDSDDWVHERYVELLLKAATEYDANVSMCGFVGGIESSEYSADIMSGKAELLDPEKIWCENITWIIVPWCKLYNRNIWKEIRFPVGKVREDEFITYKIMFENKTSVINEPLYYYFKNPTSTTRKEWTPNHLAIFEAKREQISFFKNQGFKRAYEYTIINYIHRYSLIIRQIKEILPKYKDYYKRLRKEQKKVINKYRKEIKIPYASMYIEQFKHGIKDMNIFQKLRFLILYIKQSGARRL